MLIDKYSFYSVLLNIFYYPQLIANTNTENIEVRTPAKISATRNIYNKYSSFN